MECVRTNKIQILNSENRNDNNNNKIKGLILKQNEKGKKIFFTKTWAAPSKYSLMQLCYTRKSSRL